MEVPYHYYITQLELPIIIPSSTSSLDDNPQTQPPFLIYTHINDNQPKHNDYFDQITHHSVSVKMWTFLGQFETSRYFTLTSDLARCFILAESSPYKLSLGYTKTNAPEDKRRIPNIAKKLATDISDPSVLNVTSSFTVIKSIKEFIELIPHLARTQHKIWSKSPEHPENRGIEEFNYVLYLSIHEEPPNNVDPDLLHHKSPPSSPPIALIPLQIKDSVAHIPTMQYYFNQSASFHELQSLRELYYDPHTATPTTVNPHKLPDSTSPRLFNANTTITQPSTQPARIKYPISYFSLHNDFNTVNKKHPFLFQDFPHDEEHPINSPTAIYDKPIMYLTLTPHKEYYPINNFFTNYSEHSLSSSSFHHVDELILDSLHHEIYPNDDLSGVFDNSMHSKHFDVSDHETQDYDSYSNQHGNLMTQITQDSKLSQKPHKSNPIPSRTGIYVEYTYVDIYTILTTLMSKLPRSYYEEVDIDPTNILGKLSHPQNLGPPGSPYQSTTYSLNTLFLEATTCMQSKDYPTPYSIILPKQFMLRYTPTCSPHSGVNVKDIKYQDFSLIMRSFYKWLTTSAQQFLQRKLIPAYKSWKEVIGSQYNNSAENSDIKIKWMEKLKKVAQIENFFKHIKNIIKVDYLLSAIRIKEEHSNEVINLISTIIFYLYNNKSVNFVIDHNFSEQNKSKSQKNQNVEKTLPNSIEHYYGDYFSLIDEVLYPVQQDYQYNYQLIDKDPLCYLFKPGEDSNDMVRTNEHILVNPKGANGKDTFILHWINKYLSASISEFLTNYQSAYDNDPNRDIMVSALSKVLSPNGSNCILSADVQNFVSNQLKLLFSPNISDVLFVTYQRSLNQQRDEQKAHTQSSDMISLFGTSKTILPSPYQMIKSHISTLFSSPTTAPSQSITAAYNISTNHHYNIPILWLINYLLPLYTSKFNMWNENQVTQHNNIIDNYFNYRETISTKLFNLEMFTTQLYFEQQRNNIDGDTLFLSSTVKDADVTSIIEQQVKMQNVQQRNAERGTNNANTAMIVQPLHPLQLNIKALQHQTLVLDEMVDMLSHFKDKQQHILAFLMLLFTLPDDEMKQYIQRYISNGL